MQAQTSDNKALLTINEVAKIFNVHPATIRRWDNEGKLKAVRIGERGHRKYKKDDIETLLK
jgi:DNA (cytosine-5)-methyltransferase 1